LLRQRAATNRKAQNVGFIDPSPLEFRRHTVITLDSETSNHAEGRCAPQNSSIPRLHPETFQSARGSDEQASLRARLAGASNMWLRPNRRNK